jgi:hypothetical protein
MPQLPGSAGPLKWLALRLPVRRVGIVALLAVTGCRGAGHSRPGSHAVAGGPGLVPGHSDHHAYLPCIPVQPPPGARIIACFAGPARAAARGFPLPVPRVQAEGLEVERRERFRLGPTERLAAR